MTKLLASEVKKSYKKEILLLFFLLFILFSVNYSFLDKKLISFFSTEDYLFKEKLCFVERVIDGDTIIACGNTTRLLGINTPEKNEKYYTFAKEFLTSLIENKTVKLKFSNERLDKYKRVLAYVYYLDKNVNLELIEKGLANPYFPSQKDENYQEFFRAWGRCDLKSINLCERSTNQCANCIGLEEFNFKKEEIILKNNCDFSCSLTNWTIEDEGRKRFIFPDFLLKPGFQVRIVVGNKTSGSLNTFYWEKEEYVWTDSGDTLFLRDSSKKLVLWKNYF